MPEIKRGEDKSMKQIKLTRKQKAQMDKICDFFMEATEPIEDTYLRGVVSAKILSRLACYADRLTGEKIGQ